MPRSDVDGTEQGWFSYVNPALARVFPARLNVVDWPCFESALDVFWTLFSSKNQSGVNRTDEFW
jgi:hypothetical protein